MSTSSSGNEHNRSHAAANGKTFLNQRIRQIYNGMSSGQRKFACSSVSSIFIPAWLL